MSIWQRLRYAFTAKAARPAAVLLGPTGPAAGWWGGDAQEQVRHFQSWVYTAVSAIAQEVAKHRPYGYRDTGPAEHDQAMLPHSHPLMRLLAAPEPVADAVGTVVPDGRLSGVDRQLLLVLPAVALRRGRPGRAG